MPPFCFSPIVGLVGSASSTVSLSIRLKYGPGFSFRSVKGTFTSKATSSLAQPESNSLVFQAFFEPESLNPIFKCVSGRNAVFRWVSSYSHHFHKSPFGYGSHFALAIVKPFARDNRHNQSGTAAE